MELVTITPRAEKKALAALKNEEFLDMEAVRCAVVKRVEAAGLRVEQTEKCRTFVRLHLVERERKS